MRILIIGGTRFIGPHVVQRLLVTGHEIAIFHRGQTQNNLPEDVQHILGDRRQLSQYREMLRHFAPEVVLDMMAMIEEDALGVMDVLAGIARRVVTLSSQDVYRAFSRVNFRDDSPVDCSVITEASPLRVNLYPHRGLFPEAQPGGADSWKENYDKILVERVMSGNPHLPATILRLPAVYGPGDYQHRMFAYIKRMDDSRPAILLDEKEADWRWTHAYVENVADAIVLAVLDNRASGRTYNLGEVRVLSLEERIKLVGEQADWQGRIIRVPSGTLPESLRIGVNAAQDIVADSNRIRQELGYQERVSTDVAMRRTVEWERAHPPEKIDMSNFDYQLEDSLLATFHE